MRRSSGITVRSSAQEAAIDRRVRRWPVLLPTSAREDTAVLLFALSLSHLQHEHAKPNSIIQGAPLLLEASSSDLPRNANHPPAVHPPTIFGAAGLALLAAELCSAIGTSKATLPISFVGLAVSLLFATTTAKVK